jgi:hypothetical protein
MVCQLWRFVMYLGEGVDAPARSVRGAHERFESSHRVPPIVRPLVARSWIRSAGGGASADGSRLPGVRLATDELRGYRAEHPLAEVLPVFRDLLGGVAHDEGYIFAIGGADATLLWVEGARGVLVAAERMNFVAGAVWTEAQAGTNAPGTALAVDRPVRIVGSEHYNAAVQPWSCCAAPVHDPDSQVVGVVDLTGDARLAAPHAMALVRAAAHAAEAELARRAAAADGRALCRFLDLLDTPAQRPAALLTAGGRLLHATGVDPAELADLGPPTPGSLVLPDGRCLTVEPLGTDGHVVVRVAGRAGSPHGSTLRLAALGRDCALLEVDGRTHRLSRRHSEVVVALSLLAAGVSGDRLAVALSDADIAPATLRVEMSRLRALLGPWVLGSRPYELRRPVRSDFTEVRDLLAAGRIGEGLAAYAGPLLPWSDAPVIVAAREVLEQQLRAAVLAGRNVGLLRRWVDAPWGVDDAQAWRALADNLPGGSAQRAAAAGRARVLLGRVTRPAAGAGRGTA